METKIKKPHERIRTAEVISETSQDEREKDGGDSLTEKALLAPRYLVPTFAESDDDAAYSKTQIAAFIAIGLIVAVFVGLYIYGATVV